MRALQTAITPRTDVLLRVVSYLSIAIVIVSLGLWIWMQSGYFRIQRVIVVGDTEHSSAAAVRRALINRLPSSFFDARLLPAQRALESMPWVRKALVRKEFPNQLVIHLQEHRPIALWQGDSDMNYVNHLGQLFLSDFSESIANELPVFKGGEEQVASIVGMSTKMAPILRRWRVSLKEISFSQGGSWSIRLVEGTKIELGRGSIDQVLARLQTFLEVQKQSLPHQNFRQIASVDLRYHKGFSVRFNDGVSATAVSYKE